MSAMHSFTSASFKSAAAVGFGGVLRAEETEIIQEMRDAQAPHERQPVSAWKGAYRDARKVGVPVLMLDAGRDRAVTEAPQTRLCIALPACQETRLAGAGHDLHMESDAIRGPWLAAIIGFTRARIDAKTSRRKG